MSSLLANINDSVTVVDGRGIVIDGTGFFDEVLGYPSKFWAERSVWDLTDPDDLPELLDRYDHILRNPGERVQFDLRLRTADGGWQDIELTAVNLLENPDVGGIVLTTRNITQRKALEQALEHERDRAVEEARLRSEFTARASHELRNQIHALAGLSDLVGSADVPEDVRELAEQAARTAGRLQRLVDNLLAFSRLRTAPPRPQLRAVELSALVGDVLAIGRTVARSAVAVEAHIDGGLAPTECLDEALLTQILANLVSNAAKFTEEGQITVRVVGREQDDRQWTVWSVSDTGRGIPAEARTRIFEAFEQVDRTDRSGGLGLGLAITAQLVEQLGGTIELQSEPGRGSTFTVSLPRAAEGTCGTPEAASPKLRECELDVRVLVVEDNPVNQLLVEEQLRRLGAEVTVVGDGTDAVELFEERVAFDLVLMDWQLPGLDGLSATRRIRALEPPGRRIPILGLTASAQVADRKACLDAGMDEVLAKPLALDTLSEAVRRFAGTDRRPEPVDVDDAGTAGTGEVAAALDVLVAELGARTPVRSIVSTYLGELRERLAAVTRSIETDDAGLLGRSAHRLRATSRTLGARRVDDCARRLEEAEFPPPTELVEELERVAGVVHREMRTWLDDGLEEVLRSA
jgi:PAS domain S-box-containing protein